MCELFVTRLELPPWLDIKGLHDLEAKLASIVILLMAVTFLEHLLSWEDAQATLRFGGSIALVAGTLILFIRFGERR
jgi:uncharacterized membrane protein YqhA